MNYRNWWVLACMPATVARALIILEVLLVFDWLLPSSTGGMAHEVSCSKNVTQTLSSNNTYTITHCTDPMNELLFIPMALSAASDGMLENVAILVMGGTVLPQVIKTTNFELVSMKNITISVTNAIVSASIPINVSNSYVTMLDTSQFTSLTTVAGESILVTCRTSRLALTHLQRWLTSLLCRTWWMARSATVSHPLPCRLATQTYLSARIFLQLPR